MGEGKTAVSTFYFLAKMKETREQHSAASVDVILSDKKLKSIIFARLKLDEFNTRTSVSV